MLIINNLIVKYGQKQVLNGCSFYCERGNIYGLIGLNGSGKSTLINSLYSFVPKVSGDFNFENWILHRNDIAYLETQNYYYSNITGFEYLSLFPENNRELVAEYLKYFDLPLNRIIDGYSTGMKKKLAIIGLLHFDKPIFIFDEPFNGLDLEANHYLLKLMEKLKSMNKIVIVTSHVLQTLFPICDKILWLNNGLIEKTFDKSQFNEIEGHIFQ
jgi:ABC-2 type transport system ATP-binding protein